MLKERGYYTIEANGEQIEVRFCTWTFARFCELKGGLSLQAMYKLLLEDISIGDIALLILCAAEYVKVKEKKEFTYTSMDATDWIDALGGVAGKQFTEMFNHIAGSMSDPTEKGQENHKEGKKKK